MNNIKGRDNIKEKVKVNIWKGGGLQKVISRGVRGERKGKK